ncbi:hypothetical protein Tco_1113102 [Tanacetum coccineum]|uniref:Uncharacterized protein n=1 Tax=Tanacetum coccineum TaxID=301880 RepID=A0ABQ5IRJ0_9ASTR
MLAQVGNQGNVGNQMYVVRIERQEKLGMCYVNGKPGRSIKKVGKKGNVGEPSKDENGRDDNKRTRTGNAFATTANPVGRVNTVIMEYLVKDSKRCPFWSLNEDILKITILKTNTPYPSRKIQRIRACTHQRPQRNEA